MSKETDTAVRNFSFELEKATLVIDNAYCKFRRFPESHPKYTEEWNYFWLINYYKLNDSTVDPNRCDFTEQWKAYWNNRMEELHEEDLLELSVTLRQKLDLPVEPADMKKWMSNVMAQKVKIKDKNPTVPIIRNEKPVELKIPRSPVKLMIDLNELVSTINLKTSTSKFRIESPHSETSASNQKSALLDPKPEPSIVQSLTKADLIILFGNYNNIGDTLKAQLNEYMKLLEANDPTTHQELMKTIVDDATFLEEDENLEGSFEAPTSGSDDADMINNQCRVKDTASQESELVQDATTVYKTQNLEEKSRIEIMSVEVLKPAEANDLFYESGREDVDLNKTLVNDEEFGLNETDMNATSKVAVLVQPVADQSPSIDPNIRDGVEISNQPIPEHTTVSAFTLVDDEDEDDYDLAKSDMLLRAQTNSVIIELSDSEDDKEIFIDLTEDDKM